MHMVIMLVHTGRLSLALQGAEHNNSHILIVHINCALLNLHHVHWLADKTNKRKAANLFIGVSNTGRLCDHRVFTLLCPLSVLADDLQDCFNSLTVQNIKGTVEGFLLVRY